MSSNKADALRIFTAFSGVLGSLGLIVTHQLPPESFNNTARGVTYAIAALLHVIFAIYIGKGFVLYAYIGLLLGVYTSALIQIFTPEEKIRKDATIALSIIHQVVLVMMVMVLTQEKCLYSKRPQ